MNTYQEQPHIPPPPPREWSEQKKSITILLWLISSHRFYVGKIGTGILYWLTLGGLGIWVIVDIIMIASNTFTDKEGRLLRPGS